MSDTGQLLYNQVIPAPEAIATVVSLSQQFKASLLVIGNQTTSKSWQQQLKLALTEDISIVTVDERNSTLEARSLYWQMYPPQGLTRLLPEGMRLPSRPIDDIVAILLIKRYLDSTS